MRLTIVVPTRPLVRMPRGAATLRELAATPAFPGILCAAAILLWLASARAVDLRAMTDLGLVSVLPLTSLAALGLLLISYAITLRRAPIYIPLLLLHVATLIFMLYGATTLLGEAPRFVITWRHVGIAEYISRTGTVDPLIDAYHNWPGFFALTAMLTETAGLGSGIDLTAWAPVFFNLIYVGPLIMILRAATSNDRVQWTALWLFYLTNWIGQDYFAPQALNFFLHLLVIGVLLTWFRSGASHGSAHRIGLMMLLILILAAVVSSHQLTPFFLLASLAGVTLFNRVDARGLPVLLAVMIAAWGIFPALTFFTGHFGSLLGETQAVSSSVQANVTDRLAGSAEHMFIVRARLAFTAALWLLAGLGALRRLRGGHRDFTLWLLSRGTVPILHPAALRW